MTKWKRGDYFIYPRPDGSCELGKVKSIHSDGVFALYHEGQTAAKTPFDRMLPITNDFMIKVTTHGFTR